MSEVTTPKVKFDDEHKLVTSYVIQSPLLAGLRLLFGFYTLFVLVFLLVWGGVKTHDDDSFFSYFTNLSYIGICAYFFASGVQTFAYTRCLKRGDHPSYPLQRWPRFFQFLHMLLYTTIVTFPILVTIVYWALLASSKTFETPYSAWSNISKHAFNAAFALFELCLTNVGPLSWINLPITVVILGGYLGVAYITHITQGIYTYSFLDPVKQGKLLAAYIVGIAVGQCIIFVAAWGLIKLREHLTKRSRAKGSSEKL